mgnify:CR=1 FL=1
MIRRLLYLNTHRLSAYTWRQGRLQAEASFDGNDEGLRLFGEYLAEHPRSHYSLLVNVAEEGHVVETIPFLQGKDRQTLLTRKIGQHFLGSPLSCATSLGYEKTQRKNEKVLLSALTNPAHLEPWLQRIERAAVPLAGIYTVAQFGGLLLKKLGLTAPRCLMLSMQDHSIRESYVVNGQAQFSRMAPLADSSIAGVASTFAAESGKLYQYLIGQRLIGRDESLPVFIIAHPASLPSIEKACPDRGSLSFSFIDNRVAADKLNLHSLPDDNRCDPLFLHLLATDPPRQQYAGEAHRHHYHQSLLRRGLVTAGLVTLMASAIFSARELYVACDLRSEAAALSANEKDLSQRYRSISATFPQLGIDNETLRRLTGHHAELLRHQRQPGPILTDISKVLDKMPAVVLDEIDWKNGQNFRLTVGGHTEPPETAIIRGTIRLERASPRQILGTYDELIDALRTLPGVTVTALQRPVDIESNAPLRGGDGQEDESRPRRFAVEIARSRKP